MFVELLDNHATLSRGTRVKVIGEGSDWFKTKKYFLPKSICRIVNSQFDYDKEPKSQKELDYWEDDDARGYDYLDDGVN